jgi:hypothetical protein
LGEFSRVILLHGVFHAVSQVTKFYKRPLSSWVPSSQIEETQEPASSPGSNLIGVSQDAEQPWLWRNAGLDCVDILHWAANGTIAMLSGAEHPTVLHLHFARVVLLVPVQAIMVVTRSVTPLSAYTKQRQRAPTSQEAREAEQEIMTWVQRDEVSPSRVRHVDFANCHISPRLDWQPCIAVVSTGISAGIRRWHSMSLSQSFSPLLRYGHIATTLLAEGGLKMMGPVAAEPHHDSPPQPRKTRAEEMELQQERLNDLLMCRHTKMT